jgi:HNH endonuclease
VLTVRLRSLRAQIEARADGRCEYCRAPQNACGYRFHLEHIVPSALGGPDDESNRALACASCNLAKSDRSSALDPQTGKETALFHPRIQNWQEHFGWGEDQQTLIGLTATGRATIAGLSLNSELRQVARQFWFMAGLLP